MADAIKPDPICPDCGKAVAPESLVFYRHGELFHLRCITQTTTLATAEQRERARQMLERIRLRRQAPEA